NSPRQALGGRCIDGSDILDDPRGGDWFAIDLDDLSLSADQKRRRQAQVLASVEEITMEDVIRASYFCARDHRGQSQTLGGRPDLHGVRWWIDREGEDRNAFLGERRALARNLFERGARRRSPRCPEVHQRGVTGQP